ncbi:class I SAM-dependent methyltransferase [Marinobacterium rhizophilum]|uniref:Class I SAM-dependent methyltransferase n=1 Tax=Marinobacterium rhizophilum TaxID=420402 RepID=A0ABY5HPG7_9GAMM|nr:class I SAM-dependent methyltransferase [Marinobacterium rhizophilum]UTW13859.1 class I SAM-dependent methyltransferase [Marinobacterium rhizophilum]
MSIQRHYSDAVQQDALLSRLRKLCPQGADARALAPIDQLHTGGLQASLRLRSVLEACLAACPAPRILDVGSGTGGLLRLLAERPHYRVTGLDLSCRLNQLSQALCRLYQPPRLLDAICGDAQRMPFANASFDAVVLQHSLLNMPATEQVLAQCRRVLAPGGYLLLHELVQGPTPSTMQYPVPWAQSPGQSHLCSRTGLAAQLESQGFAIARATDLTESALAWRQRQNSGRSAHSTAPDALSPALILGSDFPLMFANLQHNLHQGAIGVMEYLAFRPVS